MQTLKTLPLTQEEKERWSPMMHQVWHVIGYDVEEMMQEQGEQLTSDIIVEMVFDANRLQMYGGMTDEEYLFAAAIYDRPDFTLWAKDVLNY